MHQLESRVSRLEGAFEQMADRLTSIDGQLAGLRTDLTSAIRDVRTEVRWLAGLMATAWVTIIVSVWLHH